MIRVDLPALAVGIALAVSGCDRASPAQQPALDVAFAGCARVRPGAICEVAPGAQLTVWARAAQAELTLHGPAHVPAPASVDAAAGGGVRWTLAAAAPLDIEVRAGRGKARRSERIRLRPMPEDPVHARASTLWRERRLQEALAALAASRGDTPAVRAERHALAARIALAAGDREAAEDHLKAAVAAAEQAGLASRVVLDTSTLAFLRIDQGARFAEARAALARAAAHLAHYPAGRAHVAYYRGILALETGDLRTALEALEQAETWARRLAMAGSVTAARQVRAQVLQLVGRHAEAVAILTALRAELHAQADAGETEDPCTRAYLANNQAWIALLAREADPSAPPPVNPLPLLEDALALFGGACQQPTQRANVLVNLALAELHAGRSARAAVRLAEARAGEVEPDARLRLWILDIEARIALASGRAGDALARFQRLETLADASSSPAARWRALVGQADALEAQGRLAEATAVDRRAEDVLSAEALRIPIDAGRGTFVAQRAQGAARQIRRLLALGYTAEALAAARRARRRAIEALYTARRLAALDDDVRGRWEAAVAAYRSGRADLDAEAADDWRLAGARLADVHARRAARRQQLDRALDQALAALAPARPVADAGADGDVGLRPPAPGELFLLLHPAERGWYVFVADDQRVHARVIEDPDALAANLLPVRDAAAGAPGDGAAAATIDGAIARARRVTVMPYGRSWDLDVHALPWRGAPLIQHKPVAYALDLPALVPPAAPAHAPAAPRVLLVDDPGGDLPDARREADALVQRLAAHGPVQRLGGPAATGPAVRTALLGRLDLFHYAGHGRFDGWESHLPLAGGSRLRIGDILTLARAPRHVVLTGCETARRATEAAPESLGIAQAFLAAGTAQVVAAARPVDDALAASIGTALHADPHADRDLVQALQATQSPLSREVPAHDWQAFRVLIR